jgi:hypothetical protein
MNMIHGNMELDNLWCGRQGLVFVQYNPIAQVGSIIVHEMADAVGRQKEKDAKPRNINVIVCTNTFFISRCDSQFLGTNIHSFHMLEKKHS